MCAGGDLEGSLSLKLLKPARNYFTFSTFFQHFHSFFRAAVLRFLSHLPTLQSLSTESALLLWQKCLDSCEPPSLRVILAMLTSLELSLYVAIARMQCQEQGNNVRQIVVDDALSDFDKLTEAISRHVSITFTFCLVPS